MENASKTQEPTVGKDEERGPVVDLFGPPPMDAPPRCTRKRPPC